MQIPKKKTSWIILGPTLKAGSHCIFLEIRGVQTSNSVARHQLKLQVYGYEAITLHGVPVQLSPVNVYWLATVRNLPKVF